MMEKYPKREEPLSEALLDMVIGGSGREKISKEQAGSKDSERSYTEGVRQREERLRQLGEQRKENWVNMYHDVFKGWQGVKRDDSSNNSGRK